MKERVTVHELLRQKIGLDPDSTGPGLVPRARRARMKALGFEESDIDGYHALVSESERELEALVEEVVIPESWFFRDEFPFQLLADRAAAGWLTDPARPPLRALSVPCAGGEEPYSIAIALIDRGLPPARFHVDAVDVSRLVLESARRARYTANAFRSKDLSFRDRHFRQTPEGYELSAAVKAAVEFHTGNLLDPAMLADRPPYDMIFCRNLLIYFDEPARRLALANLDRLLSPTGLLFVGHAEQLGCLRTRFRPASDRRCFAFERLPHGEAVRSVQAPLPVKREPARPSAVLPKRKASTPMVVAPKPVAPEVAPSALVEAARLADLGRHDEAAELCEREIARGGSESAPYFLLGSIRQAAGDRDKAERAFEKAVYLDPNHDEALLALSLLAQRRGDAVAAAGYRRRAERAYKEKHPR